MARNIRGRKELAQRGAARDDLLDPSAAAHYALPRSLERSPPRAERSLTDSAPGTAPLRGLRVLDLSRVLAGPLCTMILGDLGAEVIKVERSGSGDETRHWGPPWAKGRDGSRESAYFLSVNRNKRSLAADLTTATGRELVLRLAGSADVVVENFAPGKLESFGLGFQQIGRVNPRLIYCSIRGFGRAGSDATRPGYDFTVQARAGWMAVTGEPDGPPMKVGFALADVLTGQNAAIAILAALRERETSGLGQQIEISLMDSAVAGLINVAQAALVTGEEAARYGNAHATIVPYQLFDTADRPIVVAVGNDAQWERLCRVLEIPEASADPRFATNPARVENRRSVVALLQGVLRRRPASEWIALLDIAAVPCAPVQTVQEALADPVITDRDGVWTMQGETYGTVRTVASPLRLERSPASLRRPAPALGEHTSEIEGGGWGDG